MRWGRMRRGSCLRWLQEVIGRGAGGACLGAANLGVVQHPKHHPLGPGEAGRGLGGSWAPRFGSGGLSE